MPDSLDVRQLTINTLRSEVTTPPGSVASIARGGISLEHLDGVAEREEKLRALLEEPATEREKELARSGHSTRSQLERMRLPQNPLGVFLGRICHSARSRDSPSPEPEETVRWSLQEPRGEEEYTKCQQVQAFAERVKEEVRLRMRGSEAKQAQEPLAAPPGVAPSYLAYVPPSASGQEGVWLDGSVCRGQASAMHKLANAGSEQWWSGAQRQGGISTSPPGHPELGRDGRRSYPPPHAMSYPNEDVQGWGLCHDDVGAAGQYDRPAPTRAPAYDPWAAAAPLERWYQVGRELYQPSPEARGWNGVSSEPGDRPPNERSWESSAVTAPQHLRKREEAPRDGKLSVARKVSLLEENMKRKFKSAVKNKTVNYLTDDDHPPLVMSELRSLAAGHHTAQVALRKQREPANK